MAKHFRSKGYFVTQAYLPAQEIDGGIIEIVVIVGGCGNIILRNSSHVSDAVIMTQLARILPGAYVHTSLMERAALLVGDLTGVSAKITLVPGKKFGTTDIIVETKVKGAVWQGNIGGNNQGSRLTGYNQNAFNFIVNNPLKRGDNGTVNVTTTYAGQEGGSIGYHIPIAEGSIIIGGTTQNYTMAVTNQSVTISMANTTAGSSTTVTADRVALVSANAQGMLTMVDTYSIASTSGSLTVSSTAAISTTQAKPEMPTEQTIGAKTETFTLTKTDGSIAEFSVTYANGAMSIKSLNAEATELSQDTSTRLKILAAVGMLTVQEKLGVEASSVAVVYIRKD